MYLGGVMTVDPLQERPGQVLADDFIGCIQAVSINGRPLNLTGPIQVGNICTKDILKYVMDTHPIIMIFFCLFQFNFMLYSKVLSSTAFSDPAKSVDSSTYIYLYSLFVSICIHTEEHIHKYIWACLLNHLKLK